MFDFSDEKNQSIQSFMKKSQTRLTFHLLVINYKIYLENKGILIQNKVFRASIAQYVGDYIGIHQILGL